MGDHWLFRFRLRCKMIVPGSEQRCYSVRNSDRIENGEIVAGTSFDVFSVKLCRRWRWHRGDCK